MTTSKFSKHYTAAEDAIIRENIGKIPVTELGNLVGRPWKAVHERARRLGIVVERQKKCVVCGKEFTSNMGAHADCCSQSCAEKYWYQKNKDKKNRKAINDERLRSWKIPKFFETWDEIRIRKLFDEYVSQGVPMAEYAKEVGISSKLLSRMFSAKFSEEYRETTEKHKGNWTNYKKGRDFEYRVRDILKEAGFWVFRSPASRSPVDLMAIRNGKVLFVQCKVNKYDMHDKQWDELENFSAGTGASLVLVYRVKKTWEVVFENRDRTRFDLSSF